MKKLYLFCCVLSLICPLTNIGQEKIQGCTIGVASGKATADGRPLMWKNANNSYQPKEVVYFKDGRFKYLAVVPAGDSRWISAGVNEFGFCIINAAAFNLPYEPKAGIDGNAMMKWALQQCVTADDFESLLKQTNVSGRATQEHLGVIDAFGGAAIFETGSYSYTRFDATDPKVAPQGYIVRANFAFTGSSEGDFGRARYDRTNQLWQQAVEENQLDYRYVLRKVCRDFSGAKEVSHTMPTMPEMEATESNTIKVLKLRNVISGPSAIWVALFHGVRPEENPSLTTFWSMIGEPIFSVAVPSWVIAESTAPEMDGEEFSPICTAAHDLYMANYVTNEKQEFLLNPEMLQDIWTVTYTAEDRIFNQTESTMTQWRQGYPTAQQVASFHRSMASEAMDTLEEVTGVLMQKGGANANLRIALHMRSVEKVKAFIEGGANINVSDGHGYTPLHYAIENNQTEIVQLLLARGANINTKDNLGRTPLDTAIREWRQDIVKLLVDKKTEVSAHIAAFIGDMDKVKDFIEHGGLVDAKDERGWTLLHQAAAGNHEDIAELLIEKGADVNAKGNWDWTSLHFATEDGYMEIAQLLIAAGAEINARDGGGSTPLWYAQKEGYAEIVQLLRKHGAK